MEEFRQIEGTNVEISNIGSVKRIFKNGNVKISFGSNHSKGYRTIRINNKSYRIHRLVLKYFVGECPIGFECDHINRNRSDNRVSNLRWVNRSNNNKNRKKKGTIIQKNNGTYQYFYFINQQRKSKTFKTEIEAKIAQAFYKGAIDIIQLY